MERNTEAAPNKLAPWVAFRLWIGMLLPAIAWSVSLEVIYLSSEYGCASSNFTFNHVAVVIAFAASLLGGVVAWREWTASGSGYDEDGGDQNSRRRFMALLGILGSALFSIAILAQWMPTLMGVPCGK